MLRYARTLRDRYGFSRGGGQRLTQDDDIVLIHLFSFGGLPSMFVWYIILRKKENAAPSQAWLPALTSTRPCSLPAAWVTACGLYPSYLNLLPEMLPATLPDHSGALLHFPQYKMAASQNNDNKTFLTIPIEIRMKVYEYVVSDHYLHLA